MRFAPRFPIFAPLQLFHVRVQTPTTLFFEGNVPRARLDVALAYLRPFSQVGYPLDPSRPSVNLMLFTPSPPSAQYASAPLFSEFLPPSVASQAGATAARILRGEATGLEVARPVIVFQWLRGIDALGQVAQCCERLAAGFPSLYDTTLNATEQALVADFAARDPNLTAQEQTQFAELQRQCCEALATTGTPPPGGNPTLALQKQINQVLAPHGCSIDEDGVLGGETCGAIALINERNWGSIQVPARCASITSVPPTGCSEVAPTAGAAKRGPGAGVVLLGVAALAALGAVLVGRGGG